MQISLSVVLTCYREGPLIFEAIESIRRQTYPPLEIIIVNDASPDEDTNHVCHQLEDEPDIKVVWQPNNGGPSLARNAGFEAAQGDVLVPLDADDLLPENALSIISRAFEHSPDAGFVYGPYYRLDDAEQIGQVVRSTDISLSTQLAPKPWSLSTNWRLLGTTPLRKSIWADVGGYDPTFETDDLHDVEFWIRVIDSGCEYVAVDEPIYVWRKYLGSNSSKVTPYAWYRIAQKYFDIYQKLGLTYRAHELLLLGSKWLNQPKDIAQHSRVLMGSIGIDNIRFSTLASLVLPSSVLRWLATQVQQRR